MFSLQMAYLTNMELQIIKSMRFWLPTISLLLLPLMNLSQHASATRNFGNKTDRLALLEFKHQISGDPFGILNSWNDSQHHCHWQGIKCGIRHQRVNELNLLGLSLSGSISPYIGNLSFLRFISLGDNKFYGEIPQEIGRLFRLRNLNLTNNMLEGGIPVNLSQCLELNYISIGSNRLVGSIPLELGSLQKLVSMSLYYNNLTGKLHPSIGNLTSLKILSFAYNNFQGSIPDEIGRLRLLFFRISHNNFSGMIPTSLYNISSITLFSTAVNSLNGSLPENIGLTLPNLRQFGVGGNQFYGSIPVSFTNASQLQLLDLSENFFRGQVPTNIGYLHNLQFLNFEYNLLGSNSTIDLNFIASLSNCSSLDTLALDHNNFGGELPSTIGNLSVHLMRLYLGHNQISGLIPSGLENLSNLFLLAMEGNLISGAIPDYFGKFQNLQLLSLAKNRLHGQIPLSLSNLTSLYRLDISYNRLNGNIPKSIVMYQYLQELDVSHNGLSGTVPPQLFSLHSLSTFLNLSVNSLTGFLPPEVGKLQNINTLDVSENNLFGVVPESLGDCSSLEYLKMRANFFQGIIPSSLASLKGLLYLDLSHNNLTGEIPSDLEKIQFLQYLNLSFNDLVGEVPKNGVFANASLISLVGNSKLCGGVPELGLLPCPLRTRKQRKPLKLKVTVIAIAISLIFVALASFFVLYWRKQKRIDSTSAPSKADKLPRISYRELHQATGGFSPGNLIGSGSFGSVYKGSLAADQQEERLVAVKVLDLLRNGASKSFLAECRALKNIRHRNLVPIFTYCSSIDYKGNDFKALVYEYMENDNLDMWLHPSSSEVMNSRSLSLLQRLNIAIDVASALQYLHNECEISIVHCDLKPSNILLDKDLTAHLGDFGLARLLSATTTSSSHQQLSSIGIKGTVGYAAPEYAMGGEISTKGDVYSYGILLLELFTGKRPTDAMFVNDLDLHKCVEIALTQEVMKIVDESLLPYEENDEGGVAAAEGNSNTLEVEEENRNIGQEGHGRDNVQQCLVSIFQVGLVCSRRSPKERADMYDVRRDLLVARGTFLGAGRRH